MYRAGLLAVLLLAVVAAAGASLTCTKESSLTVGTTDDIRVSFKFESIAPVFPGKVIRFTNNLVYSPAESARWDRPLKFNVTLEHYVPNQSWRIDRYRCVYNNGGDVQVRYYDVVAQTPQRTTTTITFTVPDTAVEHSASTTVKASRPLEGSYCSAPPTLDSWPNCPAFRPDPNKVSVEYRDWQAVQVNGRRPGDVVEAYGVNATIPDPWEYGIDSDVGTLSYVEVDGSRYDPDVRGVPVQSSVHLHMVGMPKRWGEVKVKGDLDVPLYVAYAAVSIYHPTTFCRPPSCFVLGYVYDMGVYVSLIAKQSGVNLHKTTALVFDLFRLMRKMHLPLGSVYMADVRVEWGPGGIFDDEEYDFVIVSVGTPFFRVINDPTYYEEVGKKGKLNGPLKSVGINNWWAETKVAFAVDTSAPSFEFDMYTWPLPALLGNKIYPPSSPPDQIVRLVRTPFGPTTVIASAWLTDSLKWNHPDISNGRYVDLLRFLYGYPATYYWGAGDQYGMVSVRTEWRYESTTADSAGSVKLYYVTGTAPTSVAALNMPWPVTLLVGPWPTSSSSPPPNNTPPPPPPPWLVWLVPTAACRSMFCTSLSPELIGPLLPFPGDRAMPNMGYSFVLMYIGSAGRHRIKVYVEDGYVISSGTPISVSRAENYKLVEIDKEWRPFEAVVVGPGWWVPYRSLKTCSSMLVNASSIYTTPDRLGPVKVIVEDNGVNSTYIFHVTNDVRYRITTRTPAPASITTTPFNMTAYVTLDGLPYYHALYGFGEGGRLTPPTCGSTWYSEFPASQLYVSGDFWGSFGLANTLLQPVNIHYIYSKPRLELVDPWRGLVRVKAEGPVAGFAFYARRGGTWVKIGEAGGSCHLVNASRLFPWDPVLVLPLVGQVLNAAPGSTVAMWRPETALLFKAWADAVGYPKGARSELKIVGTC
jgi:hypothetical protein